MQDARPFSRKGESCSAETAEAIGMLSIEQPRRTRRPQTKLNFIVLKEMECVSDAASFLESLPLLVFPHSLLMTMLLCFRPGTNR